MAAVLVDVSIVEHVNAQQSTMIYENYSKLVERRGSVIQYDG